MKKIISILLLISLILLALTFTLNAITKTILQDGINFATGLKLSIGSLKKGGVI